MHPDVIVAVREAIWLWDPYGINDLRGEAPEEYDHLLEDVLCGLRNGGRETTSTPGSKRRSTRPAYPKRPNGMPSLWSACGLPGARMAPVPTVSDCGRCCL
jgi:hypothetical protein